MNFQLTPLLLISDGRRHHCREDQARKDIVGRLEHVTVDARGIEQDVCRALDKSE